jgi:Flp pilus assembly protein TadB
MLMLIDTNDQQPPEKPRRAGREWPVRALLLIFEGVFLLVLSTVFPPFPAYILLMGALVLVVRGFARLVPMTSGLKHYKQ